ncbi:unnamed protein product [Cyclocybe aegerita]|uniref:Uncharacterized protein n=1 Tax=Cyclocybe aegerita TaxID=1973307 RepID=A0A8S0XZ80_CYCAE|nr:unnamed protein product [Cyclocybe aegerita]
MSRYSRIFLRPKDNGEPSWTAELSSKMSADPNTSSSPYSYPPSSSIPSRYSDAPLVSSPPHPYTLAAFHSPAEPSPRETPTAVSHIHRKANTSEFSSSEKPPESSTGHSYPRPPPVGRPPSRHTLPIPLPIHLRPWVLLLIFLPLPPLLSLLYMLTGHAILRRSNSSPTSIYQAPLLSSVEAGATGGVILSLPLALLLYLLLFPSKPPTAPEDFFEDDDSSMLGGSRWARYSGYAVCVFVVLCVGGVAGPLGVTCLSNGETDGFVSAKKMLSTGAAASAGFVGGAVLSFAMVLLGVIGLGLWMARMKRARSSS